MLIGLILFVVVVWYISTHIGNANSWVGKFFTVFIPILTSVLLHFIILLLFIYTGLCVKKSVYIKTTELVAVNEGNKFEGIFFIGTGTIENQPSYVFYHKTEDNGIKLDQVLTKEATIYEYGPEDGKKPVIVEYKKLEQVSERYWWLFYSIPRNTGEKNYEIHVPKGSIQSTFELDKK